MQFSLSDAAVTCVVHTTELLTSIVASGGNGWPGALASQMPRAEVIAEPDDSKAHVDQHKDPVDVSLEEWLLHQGALTRIFQTQQKEIAVLRSFVTHLTREHGSPGCSRCSELNDAIHGDATAAVEEPADIAMLSPIARPSQQAPAEDGADMKVEQEKKISDLRLSGLRSYSSAMGGVGSPTQLRQASVSADSIDPMDALYQGFGLVTGSKSGTKRKKSESGSGSLSRHTNPNSNSAPISSGSGSSSDNKRNDKKRRKASVHEDNANKSSHEEETGSAIKRAASGLMSPPPPPSLRKSESDLAMEAPTQVFDSRAPVNMYKQTPLRLTRSQSRAMQSRGQGSESPAVLRRSRRTPTPSPSQSPSPPPLLIPSRGARLTRSQSKRKPQIDEDDYAVDKEEYASGRNEDPVSGAQLVEEWEMDEQLHLAQQMARGPSRMQSRSPSTPAAVNAASKANTPVPDKPKSKAEVKRPESPPVATSSAAVPQTEHAAEGSFEDFGHDSGEDAEEWKEKELVLPYDTEAAKQQYEFAIKYTRKSKWGPAVQHFSKAIAMLGGRSQVLGSMKGWLLKRSHCLINMHRHQMDEQGQPDAAKPNIENIWKALYDARRVSELDPQSHQGLLYQGIALSKLAEDNPVDEQALAAELNAAANGAAPTGLSVEQTHVRQALKHLNMAVSCFQRALEKAPESSKDRENIVGRLEYARQLLKSKESEAVALGLGKRKRPAGGVVAHTTTADADKSVGSSEAKASARSSLKRSQATNNVLATQNTAAHPVYDAPQVTTQKGVWITNDDIRDFVGVDCFAKGRILFTDKKNYARGFKRPDPYSIRARITNKKTREEFMCVVEFAPFDTKVSSSSHSARSHTTQAMEYKVARYECTVGGETHCCYDSKTDDREVNADGSPRVPCEHIAAALLGAVDWQQRMSPGAAEELRNLRVMYRWPHNRVSDKEQEQSKIRAISDRVATLNVSELRELLQRNGMKSSGSKLELQERTYEGAVHGAMPTCPQCLRGHLRVVDGRYVCPGYFDEQLKHSVSCHFQCPWNSASVNPRRHFRW